MEANVTKTGAEIPDWLAMREKARREYRQKDSTHLDLYPATPLP